MDLTRRSFLKGLLGAGVVAAAPKIFIDMAPAWKRHEGLYVPGERWHNLKFAAKEGEITTEDINSIFQRVYGPYVNCVYKDAADIVIEWPRWNVEAIAVPVKFEE